MRAQAASAAVSTGRHTARGPSRTDARQQPRPRDEIRREAAQLGQVGERGAPHRVVGVRLAQHGEREVRVELEHGNLPLAGRHCSCGNVELIPHQLRRGNRPTAPGRQGERDGRRGRLEGCRSEYGDKVVMRCGEGVHLDSRFATWLAWRRRRRGGVFAPDPEPAGLDSATIAFGRGSSRRGQRTPVLLFRPSGKTASQHASPARNAGQPTALGAVVGVRQGSAGRGQPRVEAAEPHHV